MNIGGQQPQQYCLRWNNHRSNLLTVFDELLQNEAFTDVTLACEGGSAKCHKMVLAACSSYFQNLFTGLPHPCTHPVVVLKDVKYTEIKAILEYMYRGEVNVAQDQLAALLKVAEALKVKGLIEENGNSSVSQSSKSTIKREEQQIEQNSPPTITTSTNNVQSVAHSSSSNGSPPHSTGINGPHSFSKSPYNMYGKSPIERGSRMGLPMWAVPGMSVPHHASTVTPPSAVAAAMLTSCYEAASPDMSPLKRKKMSSMMMSRDTPILRTVLGQGQADSSQPVSLVCHPDSHENLHSNGSAYDNDKAHKSEPSDEAQSPYTDITDDDDKAKLQHLAATSPYSNDMRLSTGIATYVPTQKPEWKRYKQYTRNDIMSAIEAVRTGMSALQAARKYGVPSRTLYDKVKKLGITTSRPFKRGSNGSSIMFPYGISGTSSPYGGHIHEGEEAAISGHHPNMTLEGSFFQHSISGTPNGPGGRSPSPSPSLVQYMRQNSLTPSPPDDHHRSETNGSSERERDEENDDDQVEDLSIQRKDDPSPQQSRVIVPPMNQVSTIIKKEMEPIKETQNLCEDLRREVQVDDAN
ncbi:protein abrupt [Chrysoperla carnea]|uniref:protein abrupt n=1 Tax=Chrysoperla carnea TaxID=189513 RepID=UPI001D06ADA0|nr:protein abrupt [Chrysoperla carnea]